MSGRTRDEEGETDKKLTELAESVINIEAEEVGAKEGKTASKKPTPKGAADTSR